jgi:uncharacterized protein (TIGR02145 family)
MEKYIVVIFLLFTIPKIQAQDYLISFAGTGDSNSVTNVNVENLTSGTMVTLNAGEVLHLKSVLGVEMPDLYKTGILVYPNPITEAAFLTFVAPENGTIVLRLIGLSGSTVYQISKLLLKGEHCFRLSGINSGMYLLNVSGTNYEFTTKLISTAKRVGQPEIEYISYKNQTASQSLKSNSSTVEMQYTEGDLMLYKGRSGQLSSIITDVPTDSKTINFTFLSCTDFDGNTYPTVKIGTQTWMAENLKTTHFANGTEIPLVENDLSWDNLSYTDKAYCFYDNSGANGAMFGALYTWPAAMNGEASNELNPSFVQGACPCGWHLPSDDEWMELEMFLGMSYEEAYGLGWRGTDEGDKLKANRGWFEDGNGNNSSGFSALPGGSRMNDLFSGLGETTYFWSTTEYFNITYLAFNRSLSYLNSQIGFFSASHYYGYPKNYGFSVRCVKD